MRDHRLARPRGVELHWEETGEGPLVVLSPSWGGEPAVFQALLDDLAGDHRVVTYHLRGVGRSTREGPHDRETNLDDLEALVGSAGGHALALGVADGLNRAIRLGTRRPELAHSVVSLTGVPLRRDLLTGTSSIALPSVVDALLQQIRSDYRGAIRTITAYNNPQLDEEGIRERAARAVAHCPPEVAVPMLEDWIGDDPFPEARELGDRLWMIQSPNNPWFPPELAETVGELLPDAHSELVADGPLSRPDIFAGIVRDATRAQAGALSSERQR